MLTSVATVVERRTVLTDTYGTHPYEAAWASEALFFVRAEGPHPELTIQPQVSPDGIDWIDRGEPVTLRADEHLVDVPMVRFGTWLRLLVAGATDAAPATILVRLELKG